MLYNGESLNYYVCQPTGGFGSGGGGGFADFDDFDNKVGTPQFSVRWDRW